MDFLFGITLGIVVGIVLFVLWRTYLADKIQAFLGYIIPRLKHKTQAKDFIFSEALNRMSCQVQEVKGSKGMYEMVYSGGFFILEPINGMSVLLVSFFHCGRFNVSQLTAVRSVLNMLNLNNGFAHGFYTIEDEERCIDIHQKGVFVVPDTVDDCVSSFREFLDAFFVNKHLVRERVSEKTLQEDLFGVEDWEVHGMRKNMDLSLIRKEEAEHLLPIPENCADNLHKVGLKSFLNRVCEGGVAEISEIKVMTEQCSVVKGADLNDFDFLETVVERDASGKAFVVNDVATLLVSCNSYYEDELRKELLIMVLQLERETAMAFYVRATLNRLPVSEKSIEFMNGDMSYQESASVMLGITKLPEDRRMKEFEYMWQDARDKYENGEFDEMTEEQRFITCFRNRSHVASSLYWGIKYFQEERFYESLPFLEAVFDVLSSAEAQLSKHENEMLHEICFRLGFACNELKLYKEAYYYLEIISNTGNLRYIMEYINCLVNSKDFRAFSVVDTHQKHLEEFRAMNEDDTDGNEMSEELQYFYNFLRRRKVYLLVDMKSWDDAEKELQRMLDEPVNSDFALNELAYIQQLKKMDAEGE